MLINVISLSFILLAVRNNLLGLFFLQMRKPLSVLLAVVWVHVEQRKRKTGIFPPATANVTTVVITTLQRLQNRGFWEQKVEENATFMRM